jgi:hypothetical protein
MLDFTPATEDIKAYGGDTATIEVRAPAVVTDGMVWDAEVRTAKDSPTIDATFLITIPATSGGPAYITLSSVDTARLAGTAPVVNKRGPDGVTRAIQTYSGVWDCQVSDPINPDPVRTLVKGTITVELDVTRPV